MQLRDSPSLEKYSMLDVVSKMKPNFGQCMKACAR